MPGYIDAFGIPHQWSEDDRQFQFIDLEDQQIDCSQFGGDIVIGKVAVNIYVVRRDLDRVGEILSGLAFIPQRTGQQRVVRETGESCLWVAQRPR